MKNVTLFFFTSIMLCLSVSCGSDSANNTTASSQDKLAESTSENAKNKKIEAEKTVSEKTENVIKSNVAVEWLDIEEAEKRAKKEGKKVMIDLYTDWCGWCKKMDKATFQNPEIAQYLNDNFYAVKFDAEDKNVINFKDKEYEFIKAGRRGYNQLAFNFANGRMSYPTISFLDENLEVIKAFPGFKKPEQFEELLSFINGNHYKTKTMAQYKQGLK